MIMLNTFRPKNLFATTNYEINIGNTYCTSKTLSTLGAATGDDPSSGGT